MLTQTWMDSVLLPDLCFDQLFRVISVSPSPLHPKAVWCQFLLLPLTFPPHPPRSWHWSFSTHTGYKHSKLQIREEKKTTKQNLSDMAPKLQSKTLETKAQTCPPSEAGFSAEAAAESSGEDVPDRRHGSASRTVKTQP